MKEPIIHLKITFISKFTGDGAGAPKLVSTTEFMDSLPMAEDVVRRAGGKMG